MPGHAGAAGVELLTADSLKVLDWLVHGFSTRRPAQERAAKKDGPAFNLGFTEGSSRQEIEENRDRFARAVVPSRSGSSLPLLTVRQIHSDVSHIFTEPAAAPDGVDPPQADAALTVRAGLLLGIQTADCVPILLVDRARRVVAAVHAGWRGTLARVAQKAIGRMRLEFGSEPRDILAAIGPSIGGCCYEVGPEVAQAFAGQFPNAREWFEGPFDRLALGEEPNPLPWLTMMPPGHEPPPERVNLELRAANRWQLTEAGVLPNNITVSALCTACSNDLLFSYRREEGHTGRHTGRMMAAIGILRKPLGGQRNRLRG